MRFSTISIPDDYLDVEVGFGKYRRRTYRWIYENDLDYYDWMKGVDLWPHKPIPKPKPQKKIESGVPPIRVGNYIWIGIREIPKQQD